jgi:membrane peptidoglycan carboxypeptidase
VLTPPPGGPRPRRVRAGTVRNGTAGLAAAGRVDPADPDPAARRRARRDIVLGRRRKAPRPRRPLVRISLLLAALLATAGASVAATVYTGYNVFLGQVPDASTVAGMEPAVDTNVYSSNGTLIDILHPSGSFHLHAPLDEISKYVQEATVDIEDRHFYSESSLDLPRIVEAGVGYLRHTNAGGASTIPEQLAKISFLQDNGSLAYKIKEIILGEELVDDFSKNQILEMYLNRIPYGNQAIGIQTAAEIYFHETAAKLDLAQSALLAGLPQAPSEYNPNLNLSAAKQRQSAVLEAMVGMGSITQSQAAAAYAEKLTFYSWQSFLPPTVIDGANTSSFLTYLEDIYLPDLFQGDTFVNPGGYDIYTTLNLSDQALADQTVSSIINANPGWFVQKNGGDGALVSLDPQNGEIYAMTGSANYDSTLFGDDDMAIQTRQPGSTMKLFTYTDLIATRQYTMTTQISDEPLTLDGWVPKDYEGASAGLGYCEMEYCLGNSLNLPAVRAEYTAGVEPVANLAVAAGVTLLQGTNFPESTEYSFTLGTFPVSPLDLADGAATIADLGVHHAPSPVVKVTVASDGATVYTYNPNTNAQRVVPENVAYVMDETLSNNNFRQPEFGYYDRLTLPDRPVSAKTGTSGSGYDNFDNWTVGWTPNVLTAVWIGDPQGESPNFGLANVTSGLTGAAPIWQTYMEGVTANTPVVWYNQPSDVYEAGGAWYLPGTGPGYGVPDGVICDPDCAQPPTASDTPFSQPQPSPSPTPSASPSPEITPSP